MASTAVQHKHSIIPGGMSKSMNHLNSLLIGQGTWDGRTKHNWLEGAPQQGQVGLHGHGPIARSSCREGSKGI